MSNFKMSKLHDSWWQSMTVHDNSRSNACDHWNNHQLSWPCEWGLSIFQKHLFSFYGCKLCIWSSINILKAWLVWLAGLEIGRNSNWRLIQVNDLELCKEPKNFICRAQPPLFELMKTRINVYSSFITSDWQREALKNFFQLVIRRTHQTLHYCLNFTWKDDGNGIPALPPPSASSCFAFLASMFAKFAEY